MSYAQLARMRGQLFVLVILATLLLTACEPKKENPWTAGPKAYADYVDTGKRIAVQAGDVYGDIARDVLKAKEFPEFSSVADMLESLRMGKIDAVLLSSSYMNQLKGSGAYPDVDYLMVPEDVYVNKAAPIFHTAKLRDQYNEWFKGIAADGTWQEIVDRWLSGSLPSQEDIPQFELTGENGTLRMCDTGNYPPLIYFDANGKPAGFDVDMMSRFALHMGMKLEIEMMNYDAIIPYVLSGKADMSACTVTVTDERGEGVIFGEPSVITPAVLIVPKTGNVEGKKADGGFFKWLQTGIERNMIADNRWRMVTSGLEITMIIAIFSQLFGTVLGCFACWLLMSKIKIVRWLGDVYCGLIYGTPVVVLLMITYYIIFGNSNISNVLVAIAAFAMVVGASVAQNLKGAISTVDPVEIEAARSIGFSAFRAFQTITLPQAIRRALPSYTNGFVELVKSTAIVGYIAIQDLTRAGDIIRSRTYDAYFPLLIVAVIYLVITVACTQIFKFIVRKINGAVSL
jgi:polar amino acid transport system substrate-binding protein